MLSPDQIHSLTNLNMLSENGESYSFDHRGNGYSRGEGFAVLVLKRVSDAIRDGDTIRGIIRSSGSNQDGRTPSVTLPSATAQGKLIKRCYEQAKLSMEPVRFFEAHGTGTAVGDPTEATGFGSVFRHVRSPEDPLWIGALKANIGHLEGPSGIAGVIKTMLVLERAVIPPNNNFEKLNGKIDQDFLNLRFPTKAIPWPSSDLRRASVNSFGNGGTNAHVVLDDVYHYLAERGLNANHITVRSPPDPASLQSPTASRQGIDQPNDETSIELIPRLIPISAADEAGVQRQAKSLAAYAQTISIPPAEQQQYLDNVAYTLSHRRSRLDWRSFAVIQSMGDLANFDRLASTARIPVSAATPGVGFIFTGQGAQWAGMGRELMNYSIFQQSLLRLEKDLSSIGCTWSLRDELLRQDDSSRINSPEYSQPLCTAVQIALVDLMSSYGLHPTAVVGHSSGEIAAAYCAGALSDTSAMKAAFLRGQLAGDLARQQIKAGAMMSVGLSEHDVGPYIEQTAADSGLPAAIVVACINSPINVTISGDAAQIDALKATLEVEKIFCRKLQVDVAYHSPHMQAIAEAYQHQLGTLERGCKPPKEVTMFSSVTGEQAVLEDLATPEYWVQNMVSPVRFATAMKKLCARRAHKISKKLDRSHRKLVSLSMFIEVGPHPALQRPTKDILDAISGTSDIGYSSCLARKTNAANSFLTAVGHALCLGYDVSLDRINASSNEKSRPFALPDLPGYAFDHSKQYWDESRISRQYRCNSQPRFDLLGKPVADWNPLEPRWRNHLRVSEMPWMEDHVINGSTIYPGAGMLVFAVEAMNQMADKDRVVEGIELKEVAFVRSLAISTESGGTETQFSLRMGENDSKFGNSWHQFRLFSYEQNSWHECCHGFVRARYQAMDDVLGNGSGENRHLATVSSRMDDYISNCRQPINPETLYKSLTESGLGLGPSFQLLQNGAYNDRDDVVCEILPFEWEPQDFPQQHIIHPCTLDAIFHVALAGHADGGNKTFDTMIPTQLGRLYVRNGGLENAQHARLRECSWQSGETPRMKAYSALVMSQDKSALLAEVEDLVLTKIAHSDATISQDDHRLDQQAYHVHYRADIARLQTQQVVELCLEDGKPALRKWFDLQTHKHCDLRILEIGDSDQEIVGKEILPFLSSVDSAGSVKFTRYGQYCYMHSHAAQLKIAKDALKNCQDTAFEEVDIAREIDVQRWSTLFDVIVLPSTLQNVESALQNAQKLLKGGGQLLLYSANAEEKLTDAYPAGPREILPFKHSLVSTGLSLWHGETQIDVLQAQASESPVEATFPIVIVHNPASSAQTRFCEQVIETLKGTSASVASISLQEAAASPEKKTVYIIALELDDTFLYTISRIDYDQLKTFLLAVDDVVWVNTHGGSIAPRPEFSLATGLARVLQREQDNLSITVLALESQQNADLSQKQLRHLAGVVSNHFERPAHQETEYIEVDQKLHIPRVFPSTSVSEAIQEKALYQNTSTGLIRNAPPLKLTIGSIGLLETLHFVEDNSGQSLLADDEIEVSVTAIGLSYRDLQTANGQATNTDMGHECAGVIVNAGAASNFAPGDRVMLATTNACATLARGKACHAFKLPDDMSLTTAAAIPAQFIAAWEIVHTLGRLQEDESILIHIAASGTGQAILQVAQLIGATIYCTVSTPAKKQLLMDDYNISEEHILYSRDTSFVNGIKRLTNGRGVDVVVNSLPGEIMLASWDCVAAYGRFIGMGNKDIAANSPLAMSNFGRGASFVGFDGAQFLRERPLRARKNLLEVLKLFAEKKLHVARPLHVHDVADVQEAFRAMAEGSAVGKRILKITETSRVEVSSTISCIVVGGSVLMLLRR
jgi:acyl transferase domain-containing protein/NADPH:quinone reductase-like Zn-dependent oxidoreductase